MRGFGELESVIMHLVWDHDTPVTVREVLGELRQERAIAYTTVMSTMDNLHRKGWLDRVKDGKAYRYTATASREEYSAGLMREALAGGGDTEAVLSHFVAQMGGELIGRRVPVSGIHDGDDDVGLSQSDSCQPTG